MIRRELLAAAELTLATGALSAAVYGLVRAAYHPCADVQWTHIAFVGTGTTLSIVGLAAVLFAGRAGLLLAGDAVRAVRFRREAPPSTARHRDTALPPTAAQVVAEQFAAVGYGPAGGVR